MVTPDYITCCVKEKTKITSHQYKINFERKEIKRKAEEQIDYYYTKKKKPINLATNLTQEQKVKNLHFDDSDISSKNVVRPNKLEDKQNMKIIIPIKSIDKISVCTQFKAENEKKKENEKKIDEEDKYKLLIKREKSGAVKKIINSLS